MLARMMNMPSDTASPALRAPRLADIPQLVALEYANFSSDQLSAARFRHWIRASNCFFRVAADCQDRVAGYALILYRHNSRRARLYSIVVSPTHRGLGLAQRLLAEGESAARERGCLSLYLEVRPDNHAAIRLYEGTGYRHGGLLPGFYEDGNDALRLEKVLIENLIP